MKAHALAIRSIAPMGPVAITMEIASVLANGGTAVIWTDNAVQEIAFVALASATLETAYDPLPSRG